MSRAVFALEAARDVHHLPAEGVLHQGAEGGRAPLEAPLQQHPEKVAELLRLCQFLSPTKVGKRKKGSVTRANGPTRRGCLTKKKGRDRCDVALKEI